MKFCNVKFLPSVIREEAEKQHEKVTVLMRNLHMVKVFSHWDLMIMEAPIYSHVNGHHVVGYIGHHDGDQTGLTPNLTSLLDNCVISLMTPSRLHPFGRVWLSADFSDSYLEYTPDFEIDKTQYDAVLKNYKYYTEGLYSARDLEREGRTLSERLNRAFKLDEKFPPAIMEIISNMRSDDELQLFMDIMFFNK